MSAEKTEKKEGEEEAPKGKSKKKLILILVPVLLLIVGGVAFAMLGGKKEEPKEGEEHSEEEHAKEEEAKKQLATVKLEPFIVNLSENSSFLKCTILIEYDPALFDKALGVDGAGGEAHGGGGGGGGGAAADAGHPHFTTRQPMVRDAIIHVLAEKRVQDVITSEGKERLKEELIDAINESLALTEDPVVNIYFLDFIIQ